MTTTYEWLKSIGATESLREIASKTGLSHATLSRQINDGRFLIDTTIRLARAYGVSPVTALVKFGYLTAEEADVDRVAATLEIAEDKQLVAEVGRRLGITEITTIFDQPISQAIETTNIRHLRPNVGGAEEAEHTNQEHALAASDREDWQGAQEQENE